MISRAVTPSEQTGLERYEQSPADFAIALLAPIDRNIPPVMIHPDLPKPQGDIGEEAALTPTFRAQDLDAHLEAMAALGHGPLHPPLELGGRFRVVTYRDVDGNRFRLIELPGVPLRS